MTEASSRAPVNSEPSFETPVPALIGLSPMMVFVALIVVTGVLAQDFTAMPILTGIVLAAAYALALSPTGVRLGLGQKVDIFCTGAGDKTIILMGLVFLLAGAFYAITIDIGARDATVNLGLTFVPSRLLLPGLFLIACFISFAMGTSMGTITAIAPIGIGLAEAVGLSVPLALGIVIGGAMFGDNLSFISDTTIAATRTQGVQARDKFRANLLIVLPAVVCTFIGLLFVPIDTTSSVATGDYNILLVLPYLIIIACALTGMNVIAVLGVGIATGCAVGLGTGAFSPLEMFASLHKGMSWMQELVIIALVIGGIVALMRTYGGIDWLLTRLTANAKTARQTEFSIAALVSVLDISMANNTVSIVSAGPIARDLGAKFQIDPRRIASLLDVFSCGCQGIVPHGGQMLAVSALAGISPLAVLPFSWYPMALLFFGVLAIAFNLPRFKDSAQDDLAV